MVSISVNTQGSVLWSVQVNRLPLIRWQPVRMDLPLWRTPAPGKPAWPHRVPKLVHERSFPPALEREGWEMQTVLGCSGLCHFREHPRDKGPQVLDAMGTMGITQVLLDGDDNERWFAGPSPSKLSRGGLGTERQVPFASPGSQVQSSPRSADTSTERRSR